MTSIYQTKTTVAEWYGSSVTVPQLNSTKFIPFAGSCLGIAISLLDKKTNRKIKVGLSGSVDTAYADPTKSLIVISNKFMRGDFSAIGADKQLSAPRTVGSVLGVIVHEIGHFAYSPVDLSGYISFVESNTSKRFTFQLARTLANVLEDIFIEYQVARLAPTLEWTLAEVNRIMLTDQLWANTQKTMKAAPVDPNQIINFLLFAKVTAKVGRVDPFAKQLFDLARSVTKKESLSDRFALCLRLYDLIAPEKSAPVAKPQSDPSEPEPQLGDSDNEPQSDPEEESEPPQSDFSGDPEESEEESTEEDSSDSSGDSSGDNESEEDSEEESATDSGDSGDSDPEDSEEEESDLIVGGSGDSSDPEEEPTEEESDPEEESGSGEPNDSTGDNEPESEESDPSDPEVGHSESSGSPEFDPESIIPTVDTFAERENSEVPYYDELSTELGYKPSLDGHIVMEKIVESAIESLDMDRRYTRLSEIAKQRTNANVGYGEQKSRGRNLRQLYRIATDQKVFSTRIIQETVKPFECLIVMDCSGSMTNPNDMTGTVKLIDASKAVLGAATGLEYGKAIVSVYGHTSDARGTNKQLQLYTFKNSAESLTTLARRLYSFNFEQYKYVYSFNRDGYALYELAKKFVTTNRQKIMIVISDGAPNGRGMDYDGYSAQLHTKKTVDALRKSGIKVYSISVDSAAFDANNRIYGKEFNTCAASANAIDDLVRQLYA